MIKINLLIKSPPLVRWRLMIRIGLAFLLLGILGISAFGWTAELRTMGHQVTETRKLMDDYARVAGRLPEVLTELEALQAQEAVVAQLGRNQRSSQAAVLEGVLVTPPAVWVTNVEFIEAEVVITGESTSFVGAMQYLAALRASSLLQGVTERSLRTIESGATHFTFAARRRGEVKQP